MKVLGITPARGGSKGVLKKNVREIAGKPLIAWTIEAAKKSKLLDEYLVSTDDKEIAEIARGYGVKVIDRPKELSDDVINIFPEVLKHALKNVDADIVVLLQCTSPVKEEGLIDYCIQKFIDSGADALATGYNSALYEWGSYTDRKQDLKNFFHDDGNILIWKKELIEKGERLGQKNEKVLISKEQNFEIDDEFDFWLNEQILLKRNNNN